MTIGSKHRDRHASKKRGRRKSRSASKKKSKKTSKRSKEDKRSKRSKEGKRSKRSKKDKRSKEARRAKEAKEARRAKRRMRDKKRRKMDKLVLDMPTTPSDPDDMDWLDQEASQFELYKVKACERHNPKVYKLLEELQSTLTQWIMDDPTSQTDEHAILVKQMMDSMTELRRACFTCKDDHKQLAKQILLEAHKAVKDLADPESKFDHVCQRLKESFREWGAT